VVSSPISNTWILLSTLLFTTHHTLSPVSFPTDRQLEALALKCETAGQRMVDSSGCLLSRYWFPGLASISTSCKPTKIKRCQCSPTYSPSQRGAGVRNFVLCDFADPRNTKSLISFWPCITRKPRLGARRGFRAEKRWIIRNRPAKRLDGTYTPTIIGNPQIHAFQRTPP
jgi:hypothetical protein